MPKSESEFAIRREFASSIQKAFAPLLPGVVAFLCLAAGYAPVCRAAEGMEENAQETLSISLRGNPSTGQFWSWTAEGNGAVRETDIAYSQDNDMPGSPATYTHTFVGEKEGDVTLRFVYSRSEPPNPGAPMNVYGLRIFPDQRIAVLDSREDIVGAPQSRR